MALHHPQPEIRLGNLGQVQTEEKIFYFACWAISTADNRW